MFGFSSQDAEHAVSPATMRDVRCRDRMEPSCREPGIQTHGGPDQEKPSGLAPRAAPGVALVLEGDQAL